MKNNIKVRFAKNHDSKQIFRFLCEMEEELFDLENFETNYGKCISGMDNVYLVAVDEQNMAIGFISCHGQTLLHLGGVVYEIQELFVSKSCRSKGVGRLLLKSLEEYLKNKVYTTLRVSVSRKKLGESVFFKNNGFSQTHIKLSKIKVNKISE